MRAALIWRIAGELDEDDWARAKRWSAKASCAEAKKRWVECRPGRQRRRLDDHLPMPVEIHAGARA